MPAAKIKIKISVLLINPKFLELEKIIPAREENIQMLITRKMLTKIIFVSFSKKKSEANKELNPNAEMNKRKVDEPVLKFSEK